MRTLHHGLEMVFFDFLRFHINNNVHVTVTIVLVSNSETLILNFFSVYTSRISKRRNWKLGLSDL